MSKIQVFEYNSLQYGVEYNGVLFKETHFNALVKLNELHQNNYFTVGFKKISFKQFVGVIQVDNLTIEILPKIDNDANNEAVWQNILVQMLRVTKKLKVQKIGEAQVQKQQIHLLDIYFEWFLTELQLLQNQGLIKKYYQETNNVKALKGKLEFAGHITKNLVHKERFYTSHQIYNKNHLIHQILYKALGIIEQCTKGNYLYSKCKTIQLGFPEVDVINVTEATFLKLPKTRKTAPYKTAIAIARLIILNFAPNISSGNERMLALLFDMNNLWEEYILIRLKQVQEQNNVLVFGQQSKNFWNSITIRPDIIIEKNDQKFIIDTKWKNINGSQPSTNDLRQMYVYNDYWLSQKAMLLYPANEKNSLESINFIDFDTKNQACSLGEISIFNADNVTLNPEIGNQIINWFL